MFFLLCTGSYFLLENIALSPTSAAKKAALHRGGVKATWLQASISRLAAKIAGHISFSDELKRQKLQTELISVGSPDSPEQFMALTVATAILHAIPGIVLLPITPLPGLILATAMAIRAYRKQRNKLTELAQKRREVIEMELPQFARTIRQSLSSTRDVVQIMEAYRKICGPVLRKEIDRTLNDLKSGNAHKALTALDARINSPQVSALVRGLIGLLQGDDQRNYFEMVAFDCAKAQDELIKRELLKRPDRLNVYGWYLVGCVALMIAVALGGDTLPMVKSLFSNI